MAQASTSSSPWFDFDAALSLQKDNVATVVEAHRILTGAGRAIAELNVGLAKEVAQHLFGKETLRNPETMLTNARADAQRAVTVAREGFDLGIRAQGEVADLLVKRATANLDQIKSFAAAA